MKRTLAQTLVVVILLATPSLTFAAGLTGAQISAVLALLSAFNVPASVMATIAGDLSSSTVSPLVRPDVTGSPYTSSNLGYDLSSGTRDYPPTPFGFVVVGVTAGKDFVYNPRIYSEYSFAQFGSSRPTLYLNLNAPYGSTATAANVSTPHPCSTLFGAATTSALAGGTYPEPTTCASYNYGWNAARSAYAYAVGASVSAPLWWLDIEEANSWSADTAVNDAVMQGAIDYLNSQNIRVGIYSVPYMWREIAGSFSPIQSLSGASATTPTWFPIGTATEVQALNACLTKSALISTSPVWVIQYEASTTAIDQNIAC